VYPSRVFSDRLGKDPAGTRHESRYERIAVEQVRDVSFAAI